MQIRKLVVYLHTISEKSDAQMAESVDALVSNTSRFTPVPVRPRLWVLRERNESFSLFFVWFFVLGESRPLVIVCVAVWLYTSKLAKPHPNPHRLTPMLSP